MGQLTTAQRIFCVQQYYKNDRSLNQVLRLFAVEFPGRAPPTKRTIKQNVKKFETHGTLLNRNKGNSGGPRTVRTEERLQQVRDYFENNGNRNVFTF